MSTLNLHPNLPVMIVQAGLFFTNLYVVKKLMLVPYLKVREKRLALTIGTAEAAKDQNVKNEQAASNLSARIQNAVDQARANYQKALAEAQGERNQILTRAEQTAREQLKGIETQIAADLARERADIPKVLATLSDLAFKQVIGK